MVLLGEEDMAESAVAVRLWSIDEDDGKSGENDKQQCKCGRLK